MSLMQVLAESTRARQQVDRSYRRSARTARV